MRVPAQRIEPARPVQAMPGRTPVHPQAAQGGQAEKEAERLKPQATGPIPAGRGLSQDGPRFRGVTE